MTPQEHEQKAKCDWLVELMQARQCRVAVRPPAPINPIVNDAFTMGFILCTGRTRTAGKSLGSEGSAAGGRRSDLSEWQRSIKSRKSVRCEDFIGNRNRTPGTK